MSTKWIKWITTLPICPSCCAHQCPYFCLTPRASFSVRLSGTVWSCCRVFCSAAAGRAPPSTLLCSGRRLLHIGIGGRGRGPVAHQPPPFPSSSPFSFFSLDHHGKGEFALYCSIKGTISKTSSIRLCLSFDLNHGFLKMLNILEGR